MENYIERLKQSKDSFPLLVGLYGKNARAVIESPECIPNDLPFYVIATNYNPKPALLN